MSLIIHEIQLKSLIKIKRIIEEDSNGNRFIIVRRKKY